MALARLSRSGVKSRHPRLKKLIRYLGVLAPQSRGGDWKKKGTMPRDEIYMGEGGGGNSSSLLLEGTPTTVRRRLRRRAGRRGPASDYIRQPPRKTSGHLRLFPFHPALGRTTVITVCSSSASSSSFHQGPNKNVLSPPPSPWSHLYLPWRERRCPLCHNHRSPFPSRTRSAIWILKREKEV